MLALLAWTRLPAFSASAAEVLPSADEVLQRLLQHSQAQRTAESQDSYRCTRRTVTEELDPSGRVTNRKVNVGETHSSPGGAKAANKWSSQNGITLDQELLQRYRFSLFGKEDLKGRLTFVLTFVPKDPPMPVHHFQDRLLNRAVGTLWVDATDYELVKANISLGAPVSFGILGAVEALNFGFERTHTEDGEWLTSRTDTFFKGRKFLKPIQFRKEASWSDFERESSTQPTNYRPSRR